MLKSENYGKNGRGEKLTLTELKIIYLLPYPARNQRLAFRKTALAGAI